MATVTQLLDHLIKAAADMGKLKDPIPSTLIKARARIEHLEAQLAATETMRDRIAMQLLPSALACHTEQGDRSDSGSIRRAYELADEFLAVRMQGSAGAPGETTSPENSAPAIPADEQQLSRFVDVRFNHDPEDGWYEAKFPSKDHWVSGSWADIREDIEAAGLTGRWVGKDARYCPDALRG